MKTKTNYSKTGTFFLFLFISILFFEESKALNLGEAAKFGVLSAQDIGANQSIIVKGKVGASLSIDSNIISTDSLLGGGAGSVNHALLEMRAFRDSIDTLAGTSISPSLNGQSLTAGTYLISGSATLDDTLILNGTSSSIFIFLIQDSLLIDSGAYLKLGNIKANNIYWRVHKNTLLENYIAFSGIIFSDSSINSRDYNCGRCSFFSEKSISLLDHCNNCCLFIFSPFDLNNSTSSFCTSLPTACNIMGNPYYSNLILNPGFEDGVLPQLPGGVQLGYVSCWSASAYPSTCGGTHNINTPDYFDRYVSPSAYSTCGSSSGSGCVGTDANVGIPNNFLGVIDTYNGGTNDNYVATISGEILEGMLTASLLNKKYIFSSYYAPSDCFYSCNSGLLAFCVSLSNSTGAILPICIQDEVVSISSWQRFVACVDLTSTSNVTQYDHILITDGSSLNNSTYQGRVLHDDVRLQRLADAGPPQTVCGGIGVVLGSCDLNDPLDPFLIFNYSWSPSTGLDDPTIANPTATPTTTTTYTVTVTSNWGDGCTATDQITVTVDNLSGISISAHSDVTCYGDNDGTATATVSGGTSPFSYTWSPSGGTSSTATGLSAGVYTCTVTDAHGCTATSSVTITQPSPISFSEVSSPNPTCHGYSDGSVNIGPNGGTPFSGSSYHYSWSPGGQTTQNITGLSAGIYTCTVTDANGCTATTSVTLIDPTLTASISAAPGTVLSCTSSCSITLTASPSSGVTYSWSTGSGTSLTIISTSSAVNVITANTYKVTVTNANGCTATASSVITGNCNPPSPPEIHGSSIACDDHGGGTYWIAEYADLATTYYWHVTFNSGADDVYYSGAGAISENITWPGGLGGTITVTAHSNINGCETTTTLYVYDCCYGTSSTWNNRSVSDFGGGSLTISSLTDGQLVINGTLVVDEDLTFNDCSGIYMAEGSSIIVKPGRTLSINNSILYGGCCKMWYGIILKGGSSTLSMSGGATLKDAQYAVSTNKTSVLFVDDSHFINNYIGIYFRNDVFQTINNTEFICDDAPGCEGSTISLIPPFANESLFLAADNLPATIGNHGFAGIYIESDAMDIGYTATAPNIYFNKLSNGIIAMNTNLRLKNCYFQNIAPDWNYNSFFSGIGSPTLLNGSGIFSLDGQLTYIGWGEYAAPFTYKHCSIGISKVGGFLRIKENSSDFDVLRGAYLTDLIGTSVISLCNWNCKVYGIQSNENPNNPDISISDNDIQLSTSAGGGAVGINCSESSTANLNNFTISDNTILFNRGSKGISLNKIHDASVTNNDLTMNGNYGFYGIYIADGGLNTICYNNVHATSHIYHSGYLVSMSDGNELTHNTSSATYYGFRFLNNCDNTVFRRNTMAGTSYCGLYCEYSPQIGTQYDAFNAWTGTFTSTFAAFTTFPITDIGAYAWGQHNLFTVSTIPSNNYYSCSTTPYWFCDNGSDLEHECNEEMSSSQVTAFDTLVAQDSLVGIEFIEQSTWLANLRLFEKLNNDTSLIGDSLLLAFYTSRLAGNIGKFTAIDDSIEKIHSWQTTETIGYLSNDNIISIYNDSIGYIDSLMFANPGDPLYTDWQLSLMDYHDTLSILMDINDSLLTIIKTTRNEKLDELKILNALISPSGIYEENQQIINDIYLSTVARNTYEFSSDQADSIHEIAWQCPLSGGPAVYSARSMYEYIYSPVYFDDDSICAGDTALRIIKPIEKTRGAFIYPNPATDKATLVYQIGENDNGSFILYNSYGIIMKNCILDPKEKELKFDTSQLKSGIYSYCVYNNKEAISRGKLVLLK